MEISALTFLVNCVNFDIYESHFRLSLIKKKK